MAETNHIKDEHAPIVYAGGQVALYTAVTTGIDHLRDQRLNSEVIRNLDAARDNMLADTKDTDPAERRALVFGFDDIVGQFRIDLNS